MYDLHWSLWQVTFVLSALSLAVPLSFRPTRDSGRESIGVGAVNVSLFLLVSTGGMAFLTISMTSWQHPAILIYTAIAVGFTLSILSAILLPVLWLWRLAIVGVIVVTPALALAHTIRQPNLYQGYEDYVLVPASTGETGERIEQPLWKTLQLLSFQFFGEQPVDCGGHVSDTPCRSYQKAIEFFRGKTIFYMKVLWLFAMLFPILRFYGWLYELRQEQSRDEQDYDLKRGVIAQSAAVLSFALAILASLVVAGVNFAQLGIFGGLVAAGVSVALKDTLGNMAAGIILLWDGTIKKDDVITITRTENPETGGTYGIVKDVRLRYTLIKDRDTVHRLIPNLILINSVVENWTHDRERDVRLKVDVPVPYGVNLRKVRNILESSCYEVQRVLKKPPPKALVTRFADSAIMFSLRFYIRDPERGIRAVISEVYSFVVERLSGAEIKIPFPQVDLHIKRQERNRSLVGPEAVTLDESQGAGSRKESD